MSFPFTAEKLSALWRLSVTSLESLSRDYGLAASDSETGLYDALFGRDSLWSLLLLLDAAEHSGRQWFRNSVYEVAARILHSLGSLQATEVDERTEASPGKIPHEVRERLDARLEAYGMPFSDGRSYAGFDQTFLYVTAVRRYLDAVPDAPSRSQLTSAARRAIRWIEDYADADGDGLFEHVRRDGMNPLHQVWKDSFDSITITGFDAPAPPVAWVEVQGYAYRALQDGAVLLRSGEPDLATRLDLRADELRARVEATFWIDDRTTYAVALDGSKRPVISTTTNAAHLLWAGLPAHDRAAAVASRLGQPDCLTPFGLRSLASTDPHYAPYAYHRGSVWPFDNAVAAAGLLEYGSELGVEVLAGICDGLELIGTCAEAYVVIDTELFVYPRVSKSVALSLRRLPATNSVQAFSVAALAYAVCWLAAHWEVEFDD